MLFRVLCYNQNSKISQNGRILNMLLNRILFFVSTAIIMGILVALTDNAIIAGVMTFVTVIVGYYVISMIRRQKRINLIEKQCDPELFLEATEKQRKITGRNPKMNAFLDIDKSAALILMGEFQKAKEVLTSIDKSYLSAGNTSLFVYTINLIACLYELGDISSAEEIFETQIPLLSPINYRLTLAMELLTADRFFFLNRIDESVEKYKKLIKGKITPRIRMCILYRLAQMDEMKGNIALAKQKYKEVADNGNKLWIALKAKERLVDM